MKPAAEVALSTVKNHCGSQKTVKEIRFLLFDGEAMETHQKVMEEVF